MALKSKLHELVTALLSRGADVSLPSYETMKSGELKTTLPKEMIGTDPEMRRIANEYAKFSPSTFKYYEKSSQDKIRCFYILTNDKIYRSVRGTSSPLGLFEDVHKVIFTLFLQILNHENTNFDELRKWSFRGKGHYW